MTTAWHEAVAQLFENRPGLAAQIVEQLLGSLPVHDAARIDDPTFSQVVAPERCADEVVVLIRDGEIVLAIVVEVQLRVDEDKIYSWPFYAVTLRAKYRCPAIVLVVTPEPGVAEWASRPIDLGAAGTFRALVLGPDAVPRVTSVEDARANPELAVLSVLAHGKQPGASMVAFPALVAVRELDAGRARFYTDLVLTQVSLASRQALENLMETKHKLRSAFFRNLQKEHGPNFEKAALQCMETFAQNIENFRMELGDRFEEQFMEELVAFEEAGRKKLEEAFEKVLEEKWKKGLEETIEKALEEKLKKALEETLKKELRKDFEEKWKKDLEETLKKELRKELEEESREPPEGPRGRS